jgi:hypothetical protein
MLGGANADAESRGNGLIRQSSTHQAGDFGFSCRESQSTAEVMQADFSLPNAL